MSNEAGKAHLDTYLAQVHRHLGGLPDAEARETLAELRSHVLDKVAGDLSVISVERAITELGPPRDVARLNVTERVVADLETNRSPLRVLRAVRRLAGLSLYGLFALFVSFTGYVLSAGFVVTAISKALSRDRAGLWRWPKETGGYGYVLGVTDHPNGQELLGWWIIPISIVLAVILGWSTWRFGLFSLRRMRRSAQRGRA